MKILVAIASKHGSTAQIGETIADELVSAGLQAEVHAINNALTARAYDAAVIGSAIYMGNWLPEARSFVERQHDVLAEMPVWIFSSGPLGEEDPQPKGDPNQLDTLMIASGAREHRMFVGKLDPDALSLKERLIARMVKAPAGDFREWDAIQGWAKEIASVLQTDLVDTVAP